MPNDRTLHRNVADLNCRRCGVPLSKFRGTKNRVKQVSLAVPDLSDDRRGKQLTNKRRQILKQAFLSRYSVTGTIGSTCKEVGVEYSTFIRWKEDPTFMLMFKAAEEQFKSVLEKEMIRRAVDGVDEPVASAGKVVAYKRRYSDALLLTALKANDPEKYGDKSRGQGIELTRGEDGTVNMKVYQGFNPDDV